MAKKPGKVNAARLFQALGRIGYRPASAILDIVDNSISAKAKDIHIKLTSKVYQDRKTRSRPLLKLVMIADNGTGMNEAQIDNAMTIGSSPAAYTENSLSKFGLGLKSASASLGRSLMIITKTAQADQILRASINHQDFVESDYTYDLDKANLDEIRLFQSILPNTTSGTLIIIDDLHENSLPPYANIENELLEKIGVTYFYALSGKKPYNKINITLNGKRIEPVDPLFTSEIDPQNGNLVEGDWNGVEVKWITRPKKIQLDLQGTSHAMFSIVQLPHPPSFERKGLGTKAQCREKYLIGAHNYGFFVYRNGRLITWGDSLEGMIPRDQDLYSFRGILEIEKASDDILNIDVTKSRITLSEIAESQLTPDVAEAKKKSIEAWRHAKEKNEEVVTETPRDELNTAINKVEKEFEKEEVIEIEAAPAKDRSVILARKEAILKKHPAQQKESEEAKQKGRRVIYVPHVANNAIWERAHDPEFGLIVKVNESHRFVRDVLGTLRHNANLIKTIDLLFFSLARAEYTLIYKQRRDINELEEIMAEFRENVGTELSNLLRSMADNRIELFGRSEAD